MVFLRFAYAMVEKTSPSTALDEYAEPRGADGETLRDTALAEFGLDESGKKVYDLGGNTIIVALAQDLTLSIFNGNAGKAVKSIPKKGADPKEDRYSGIEIPYRFKGQEKRGVSFSECDREYDPWGGAAALPGPERCEIVGRSNAALVFSSNILFVDLERKKGGLLSNADRPLAFYAIFCSCCFFFPCAQRHFSRLLARR